MAPDLATQLIAAPVLIALLAAVVLAPAPAAEPDRDGLLLEYRFDGDLQDGSGAGHHAKAQGTPAFAPGRAGQCLSLDGKAYVDSGTNLPGLTDTFTVECWVKPAAAQRPYADILGNHHNNFAGFALQQDGEQANHYYFTYGTGGAWVYSRTLALAANEWQHVAVVKTPDRLRVYLNGMLADSQAAERPMAVSPTPFMVGLGIESQARLFSGQIDEVRVWDRARAFRPLLPEAKQIEQLVKTAALECTSSSRWRLFPCREGNSLTFAIDPERVPASIGELSIAFECRDARGRKVAFTEPAVLRRAEGFRASVPVPARPGYHRLSYRPSVQVGGRRRGLTPGTFTYLVLEPETAAKPAPRRPAPVAPPPAVRPLPVLSLDGEWLLATDPENAGRDQQWCEGPVPGAKQTRVPWIIQDAFPEYHGVAWYWRDFTAPGVLRDMAPPSLGGKGAGGLGLRCLLRFAAVDYKADVWLNGALAGSHEGGETPFVLDVTGSIRPGATNRVAVRVLNPTHQPIDGMTLNQTPRRAKVIPYSSGASYNHGGIVGSVELAVVPAVHIEDLQLVPDPKTGAIRVRANVRNAGKRSGRARLDLSVAPAAGGETLDTAALDQSVPPGDTLLEAELRVGRPHLWDLNDPYLYRVTAHIGAREPARPRAGAYETRRSGAYGPAVLTDGSQAPASARTPSGEAASERRIPYAPAARVYSHEVSTRCGFREFRFEDGYFRLNGRRIFLRSSHTCNATPVGQQIPHDPDLFRRDLLYMKTMGFNCIRFIWGGATTAQLDMCDELGLMVYEESAAAVPMQDTPKMGECFDRAVGEMVRRDRNHPCVTMWGLLNETFDGPVFRHATQMLPLVRSLDETRVVMLNSGRWDACGDIGSLCNPGAPGWDGYLGGEGPDAPRSRMASPGGYAVQMGDVHGYPRVPHTADTIRWLRALGHDTGHVFFSEYGIGSAVDLWRVTRHFERLGKEDAEDARYYRDKLDRFLADWERWRLAECFASPQDFFAESLRKMAGQRTLGLNAIRANPSLAGHSVTGMMDHVNCGEGLFTLFRELKPGTTDAMFEAFAPLRLCLFAEPANAYRGAKVRLEAVLANEDALPPGDYPVRLQVVGPGMQRLLERTVTVTVPPRRGKVEAPLAVPFFDEELSVDGPAGRYRFLAIMERGGAPTGGEAEFHLDDAAGMPLVQSEVTLWGDDPELARWLAEHGVRTRPFAVEAPAGREAILVGAKPAPGGAAAWRALAERIARGSTAVFLSPDVFREGDNPVAWLPLKQKGAITPIVGWLYLKDEWAKAHPILEGLPAGGLLDTTFYREIIPDAVFTGQEPPQEAVAGAIKASQDYASGLMVSVHTLGRGRFVLNTLLIRENLGRHPAAERLLRNLLRFAARDASQPLAELPPGLDEQLRAMGY